MFTLNYILGVCSHIVMCGDCLYSVDSHIQSQMYRSQHSLKALGIYLMLCGVFPVSVYSVGLNLFCITLSLGSLCVSYVGIWLVQCFCSSYILERSSNTAISVCFLKDSLGLLDIKASMMVRMVIVGLRFSLVVVSVLRYSIRSTPTSGFMVALRGNITTTSSRAELMVAALGVMTKDFAGYVLLPMTGNAGSYGLHIFV